MNISSELNYKRKAQRVSVPIKIIIDNKNYNTKDWSMTGLGVDLGNTECNLDKDTTYDAKIILVMEEAFISIDLKVSLRVIRNDSAGFEIEYISERNRRVLRHFMSLALDGKAHNIEDLVSNFSMPDVESPIKESILLSESEHAHLKSMFLKKTYLYIFMGFIVFSLFIILIIYNNVIVYNDRGITTGNNFKITSLVSGIIDNIYVKESDLVQKGNILYTINDDYSQNELTVKKNKKASLNEKLNRQLKNIERYIENWNRKEEKNKNLKDNQDFKINRDKYDELKKDYENTLQLYEMRLIPYYKFIKSRNKFIEEKKRLEKYDIEEEASEFIKEDNSNKKILKPIEEDDKYESMNLEKHDIEKSIIRTNLEIERVKKDIERHRFISEVNGKIHSIKVNENQFIERSDLMMIVETEEQPFILMKMRSKEVLNINIGQRVLVYSPITDKNYFAEISAIGYSATDTITNTTMEISLNEILVRIEFFDKVKFPINSRVDVWVLDESNIFYPLIGLFYD